VCCPSQKQRLNVIYCDEENGFKTIAELLQCYGADLADVDTYIHYAEFPQLTSEETERWARTVQTIQPSLVVFDSFADMLALEGYDENSSVHVTRWIEHFAQPVKQLGSAALILDHINKTNSGKGARGSTAKLAKVDVAWQLSSKKPFDRRTITEPTISKDKDRMGCLPKKRTFIVGGLTPVR
jgi:RecA-family ATPase